METIRIATDEDKEQVMRILNHYVENSMAAYSTKAFPMQAWEHIKGMCIQGNLLVAKSESGEVLGFALLKSFMGMASFIKTADIGYFIAPEHVGKGLGKKLLAALEDAARSLGIRVLLANVSSVNEESLAFHQRTGFTECGRFPQVGEKLGQMFDLVWFYKNL